MIINIDKAIIERRFNPCPVCGGEVEGGCLMKKERKYFRKCGVCGERHEQSDMVRTNRSPNGWICLECIQAEHPEYDADEW